MRFEELDKYFQSARFNADKESYFLSELNKNDVLNIIYPISSSSSLSSDLNMKDTILHLFLWDLTYYTNAKVDEGKEIYDQWWTNDKKKDILTCLRDCSSELLRLIFDIIQHWDFLRDAVFIDDYKQLENCKSVTDYEEFITNHPNTYPEYLLKAKYKIADLLGEPFEELQVALEHFPESDWVKRIDCAKLKSGITYMFPSKVALHDAAKNIIVSFLDDFKMIEEESKEKSAQKKSFIVSNKIICENVWNAVMGEGMINGFNDNKVKLAHYEEVVEFIKQLQKTVCVKFRLPSSEERDKIGTIMREFKTDYKWEWCLQNDGSEVVYLIDPNKETHTYKVNRPCYAAIRLIVDNC